MEVEEDILIRLGTPQDAPNLAEFTRLEAFETEGKEL
jgi:hypothetical protein